VTGSGQSPGLILHIEWDYFLTANRARRGRYTWNELKELVEYKDTRTIKTTEKKPTKDDLVEILLRHENGRCFGSMWAG